MEESELLKHICGSFKKEVNIPTLKTLTEYEKKYNKTIRITRIVWIGQLCIILSPIIILILIIYCAK